MPLENKNVWKSRDWVSIVSWEGHKGPVVEVTLSLCGERVGGRKQCLTCFTSSLISSMVGPTLFRE